MLKDKPLTATAKSLNLLKQFTPARIALGHAGISVPVKAQLKFQLDHALAKDAVTLALDFDSLAERFHKSGCNTIQLQSQIDTHQAYLQRPDKGRLLNPESEQKLKTSVNNLNLDIAIIIVDGLSSKAISNHALPFLDILFSELQTSHFSLSTINLVKFGRVAIGDPIGEILNAKMSIVLIGERPGLSSPDSMGIYFTYAPKTGKTDAERNCISNIHKQGLDYQQAAKKLLFLIREASRLQFSGVHLKDETQTDSQTEDKAVVHKNFLLDQ